MYRKKMWKPSDGIILEHGAEQAVKSLKNILVTAGPGSGKTELLAQRASYLLETGICEEPQKILAISFKVDAAENLKKRVEKRVGQDLAKRFESRTYDSFSKSILDRFGLSLPHSYQPSSDYNMIFNEWDVKDITEGFITEIHPVHPNWKYEINYRYLFKNLTSHPLPLFEEPDNLYSWVTIRLWDLLLKGNKSLQSSLTFPMISRLAEYILTTNQLITSALRLTYSHVFLDEFQDTTYVQYDLLKKAFLGSNTILTAVGDDKQRIMGWAGAMTNSFKDFSDDFGSQNLNLIVNHRSAPRLVEIQNVLSQSINNSSAIVKCSDKWNSEDGICEIWTFKDYIEEARFIANFINKKLEKLKPRDICILVKQQEHIYAKQLIEELKSLGVQSRIEKEYQDILCEEYTTLIIDILKITEFKNAPNSWQNVINLIAELKGLDLWVDIEKMGQVELDLYKFIEELKVHIKNSPKDIQKAQIFITDMLDKIIDYFGLVNIKNLYPKYSKGNFLEQIKKKVSQKITKSYLEQQSWDKAILDFLGEFSVPIMTIHKSKGLEYKSVFFLGLEDDAFWSFKDQSESDIRAFFVALSRAKNEVFFTFSESREIKKYGDLQTSKQSRNNISSLYKLLVDAQVKNRTF